MKSREEHDNRYTDVRLTDVRLVDRRIDGWTWSEAKRRELRVRRERENERTCRE